MRGFFFSGRSARTVYSLSADRSAALLPRQLWADVLADPRARKRERRTDLAVKQAFYRLADEKRDVILVACSKCDWRAAYARNELIAAHGADYCCYFTIRGRRPS